MLHFNELRYSQDNSYLIIDVSVDSSSWYKDVVIDSILIDTQDTYVENGPSSSPVYTYSAEEEFLKVYSLPENGCSPVLDEDESYCFVDSNEAMKHIRLVLKTSDLSIDTDNDILFVYAVASGEVTDSSITESNQIMGTVFNLQRLYSGLLCSIKEVEDNCNIPKNFINQYLRYKAVDVAIRTGNYTLAIKYWNKFFSGDSVSQCGCV